MRGDSSLDEVIGVSQWPQHSSHLAATLQLKAWHSDFQLSFRKGRSCHREDTFHKGADRDSLSDGTRAPYFALVATALS